MMITRRGRAATVLVSAEAHEGSLATRDEMRYPDWEKRLRQAKKQSKRGEVSLDAYLQRRARR